MYTYRKSYVMEDILYRYGICDICVRSHVHNRIMYIDNIMASLLYRRSYIDMGSAIYAICMQDNLYGYGVSYIDIASAISIWHTLYVYRLFYMHMAYAICIQTDVATKIEGGKSVSGFLSHLAPHIYIATFNIQLHGLFKCPRIQRQQQPK